MMENLKEMEFTEELRLRSRLFFVLHSGGLSLYYGLAAG